MLKCQQTKKQSVYQHGLSVRDYFNRFKNVSLELWDDQKYKLPKWYAVYQKEILANLHDPKINDLYTLYHDCGKPYCLEIDSQGRRHFPEHAAVSHSVFLDISSELDEDESDKAIAAELILDDMVIHTATAKEIQQKLIKWNRRTALTLLIAALAEIHSNANMFGGIDSISFKMKYRKVNKRGNQICKYYFGEKK